MRLPDEPHNDNIIWRRELREGGTIRSRNGEIPKSRFNIDSIMVASEHAEVDLGDAPRLRSLARDCYSFIRRGDVVLPLHPCRKQTGPLERSLEPGDEILVGNCVFRISWGEQRPAEVAARLTASELADAMDVTAAAPDAGPGAASDDGLAAAAPSDLPVAAGLGEHGSAPPPQPYRSSVASMLGISNDTFSAVDAPTTPGGARGGLGLPGTPSMPGGGDGILDAPTRPSALRSDILDGPTRPDARPPAMTGVDHTALPFGQAPPPVSITIGGDSLLGDREAPLPGAAAPVKPAPKPSASEMMAVVVVE
ncbi:MAG: hypothetical protein VX000_11160, partial [Myxococcota bacterium]|nr:hypothetical protein [Myxococcota bacterium]